MAEKKTIYIIRHGETDYNKRNEVQGRGIDADLNATGVAQGEAFYQRYKAIPFDKVYTSTLKRTHQTVKNFIADGLKWEQLAGLDEMDWGKHEGKSITTEVREDFERIILAWRTGHFDVRPEGGESPNDVYVRQTAAMQHIVSQEDDTVLVCMHGRAMRLLFCQLTNKPLSEMDDFPHQNTSLYIVSYKDGKYEIETFNSLEHLKDLK